MASGPLTFATMVVSRSGVFCVICCIYLVLIFIWTYWSPAVGEMLNVFRYTRSPLAEFYRPAVFCPDPATYYPQDTAYSICMQGSFVDRSLSQVFSPEKFQGNPLALVSVHGNTLSQKRKAMWAREFKYSETVFLHDAPSPLEPRLLEIFTETGEELPFAGHPVSSWLSLR